MGSSASTPSTTQVSNNAVSQESSTSAPGVPWQADYSWPANTEVIMFSETNKVLLTLQSPLICSIFQEAFEHL